MKSNMKNPARCCGLALFAVALLFAASYGAKRCAAMVYVSAYDSEWMPFQAMSPPALYRGNAQRTGVFAEAGLSEVHGIPWQKHFGEATHAGPAFADGVMYALDWQTGAEWWTFQADNRILSAPAVGNSAVYVQAFSSTLYAVE